jgi:hypothetical protein
VAERAATVPSAGILLAIWRRSFARAASIYILQARVAPAARNALVKAAEDHNELVPYWTNSLYSTWDDQFYPDGVPGAEVMANAGPERGDEIYFWYLYSCTTLSLLGRASSAIRTSLALISARRIFLSSELVSNVISRLQCWQFVWNPLRIFCARSRNTCEHFVHLIFTFSSIMKCP